MPARKVPFSCFARYDETDTAIDSEPTPEALAAGNDPTQEVDVGLAMGLGGGNAIPLAADLLK